MTLLLKEDAELLAKVFRITLDASPATPRADASDPLLDLPDLASELAAEAAGAADPAARWADLSSRRSLLDRALVGRLSSASSPAVDYLLRCFTRCADLRARKRDLSPTSEALFAYVAELCVSYAAIALLNPSFFPQPAELEAEGVLRLLPYLKEVGRLDGFLTPLVSRIVADDCLADFALPLFNRLEHEARHTTLLGDFTSIYNAMITLVQQKPLGAFLAADIRFLPNSATNGALLEARSRLGAFFRFSCFPNEARLAAEAFPDLSQAHAVESGFQSLRMSLQLLHRAMTALAKELLKNADAKEPFFKFIAAACTLNHGRAQQYFPHAETDRLMHELDPLHTEPPQTERTTSHDGFLINLGAVLLQLCEGFSAPGSPHAAKIDPTYLLSTHRLDLSAETKLCATADDVMYWLDPRNPDLRQRYLDRMREEMVEAEPDNAVPLQVSSSFGTISEYFFLTLRLLHMGLLSSFSMMEKLMQQHSRLQQELQLREDELVRQGAAGGMGVQMLEAEISRFKKYTEGMKRYILCYQAQLCDPIMLASCVRFYRLVSRWLVATAQPPPEGLPLSPQVPRIFAALPEHTMDDVAQFLKSLSNLAPQVFELMGADELHDFVTLIVTFIGAPKYVKNPYLRATFTKLLRFLIPRSDDGDRRHVSDRLSVVLHTHPLAKRFLAPAVMQFFVDIEFTGSHTGAYDKYEYRHEMNQILEYFWAHAEYKATMIEFARNTPKFVRFVNMLINDSIFSMDEALTKLQNIRKTQLEIADEASWNRQPPRQRQQRMHTHHQEEGHARYFMQFTNETLHMLNYLSAEREVALVFMLPELVGRISTMLNYFLTQLVGPKCSGLKVQNPDKYFFHPRKLLAEIASTVTHFSAFSEFVLATVRDERSYDQGNLRKALRVLQSVMAPAELESLEQFANKCVEVKQQDLQEEAELGEVPDDYLDEITAEIMDDPVRLPSGKVVDRPTIARHLLSDETDPFNRQRCTLDMLVEDVELRERIQAFRKERREAAKQQSAMDTS